MLLYRQQGSAIHQAGYCQISRHGMVLDSVFSSSATNRITAHNKPIPVMLYRKKQGVSSSTCDNAVIKTTQ